MIIAGAVVGTCSASLVSPFHALTAVRVSRPAAASVRLPPFCWVHRGHVQHAWRGPGHACRRSPTEHAASMGPACACACRPGRRRHQGRPTTHKALARAAMPYRGAGAAPPMNLKGAPIAWHAMTGAACAGPSARMTGPKGVRAGALRGPALAGHQRPAHPRPAPGQLHVRARAQRRVHGAAAGGARAERARARRVRRLHQARARLGRAPGAGGRLAGSPARLLWLPSERAAA